MIGDFAGILPRRRAALYSLFPFLIYQVKSLKTRLVFAFNPEYSQPTTHHFEAQFAEASQVAGDKEQARRGRRMPVLHSNCGYY
jgi:hypothetical protein